MFDLIIRNGWVIDGTGGPPFQADVGLLDSLISAVGPLGAAERRKYLMRPGSTSFRASSTPMCMAI